MDNLALKNERNLELKKHVNAIHCSNNLTLVQRKLFNALLFNAYSELPHKQKFQIRGKELCQLIGYDSKDTGKLKKALLGLITIAIEWNVIDSSTGHEKTWKASSILASAELSQGLCVYEYSQVMKEFLYQPEIYGKIKLDVVSQFKSNYGLALYENCIRYQGLNQTPWFPLDVFRKLMGVFGNKYDVFKDFKKRVVDIAVKEINTISHITVTPELERVDQKVTKIRFKLQKNNDAGQLEIIDNTISDELNDLLVTTFGLSQQMIAEALSKYDHSYIREKAEMIITSDSFLNGKIRGLAGYLIEALKKDYKPSKSSQVIVTEKRQLKETKEKERKSKEESRLARYELYVSKKINTYLSSLKTEDHSLLLSDFDAYMQTQNAIFQRWYRKEGIEHPAIKACFNSFIKEIKTDKLGEFLSREDFIALIDESN